MFVSRKDFDALAARVTEAEMAGRVEVSASVYTFRTHGQPPSSGPTVPVREAIAAILKHLDLRLLGPSKDCTEKPTRVEKATQPIGSSIEWPVFAQTGSPPPAPKKKRRSAKR